ncbi:unnamed protein product [Lymnaea stagnalis]|uniref:Gamma-aminobutyric acid receptor subunit beta n=1 Tax=Lymnaea stagnalis TaxID=6523 RepID=A0AAV2HL85_LYMST
MRMNISCCVIYLFLAWTTISVNGDRKHGRHKKRHDKERLTGLPRQDVLQILIENSTYNSRISPDYEQDHATVVDVQIYVLSIDTVNEQSMDYSMNIYLRQRWIDPRLQFMNYSRAQWLEIDFKLMSMIWVPDTFFRNEKKGEFHMVTVPNKLMHLYRNGTIYYSMRLSVLLSCHMRLQKYPLDIQKCPIKIASYGYTTENIIYRWIGHKPIDYNEELQLSQYTLLTHDLDNCTKTYKESKYTGSFSCVQANFILARDVGYYIIQVYVPSVLIVILSWVSFWLDVEAIPARITLGVLTVLTMTTQSSGARASLPRVSYIKAIDVWMAACLFFVFASLLEFAYINVLARRRVPYKCLGSPESFENSPGSNGVSRRDRGGGSREHRIIYVALALN